MKIGDRVYCVHNYLELSFFFKIGEEYKIDGVFPDHCYGIKGIIFKTQKTKIKFKNYKFEDFFLTNKQHRKSKLKRLNEKIS